ncbi:hypothetical protein AAGS40_22120 [Paraburkholderia sp. PREW-6R]|uniref:hypothetical protein n=1 Tax=Paraburkholderia sp. PREW-6R TaxID=3141544 RepID=UPI0031F4A5F6
MVRMSLLTVAMLLTVPAFAGQGAASQVAGAPSGTLSSTLPGALPGTLAGAPGAAFQAALPAADKVYPPLPTLAMLPPSGTDDDLPVKPSSRRKKARVPAAVQEHKAPPAPVVRLIVSDASHAYLDAVQRQIDEALAK